MNRNIMPPMACLPRMVLIEPSDQQYLQSCSAYELIVSSVASSATSRGYTSSKTVSFLFNALYTYKEVLHIVKHMFRQLVDVLKLILRCV